MSCYLFNVNINYILLSEILISLNNKFLEVNYYYRKIEIFNKNIIKNKLYKFIRII